MFGVVLPWLRRDDGPKAMKTYDILRGIGKEKFRPGTVVYTRKGHIKFEILGPDLIQVNGKTWRRPPP